MCKYRVIWFDDEFNSLNIIKEKAYLNEINLIGYSNAKDGIEELQKNIKDYDAAIIDGLFFQNADQSGPTSDKALFDVAMAIKDLASLKVLPWFILSGQTSFTKDKNRFADGLKDNQVYDKLNEEHLVKLWAEIKSAADGEQETQIRHRYKLVFDLCTEKYIGRSAGRDLLSLLKVTDLSDGSDSDFNAIRKIVDDLFIAFNKFKLLPNEFVKPTVALNPSSIFLCGAEQNEKTDAVFKKYRHLEETHLPKQIATYLKTILSVSQAGSHRSVIDEHVKMVRTSYLFKSVLYQLMDVLVWFKIYVDGNPKTENWTESTETVAEQADLIPGKVININHKGYAFFQPNSGGENIFIPPQLVTDKNLSEGQHLMAEVEEYVETKSGESKNRVKRIEII